MQDDNIKFGKFNDLKDEISNNINSDTIFMLQVGEYQWVNISKNIWLKVVSQN